MNEKAKAFLERHASLERKVVEKIGLVRLFRDENQEKRWYEAPEKPVFYVDNNPENIVVPEFVDTEPAFMFSVDDVIDCLCERVDKWNKNQRPTAPVFRGVNSFYVSPGEGDMREFGFYKLFSIAYCIIPEEDYNTSRIFIGEK